MNRGLCNQCTFSYKSTFKSNYCKLRILLLQYASIDVSKLNVINEDITRRLINRINLRIFLLFYFLFLGGGLKIQITGFLRVKKKKIPRFKFCICSFISLEVCGYMYTSINAIVMNIFIFKLILPLRLEKF